MMYFKVSTTGYGGLYPRYTSAVSEDPWCPEVDIPPNAAKHLESSFLQGFEHVDAYSWEISTSKPSHANLGKAQVGPIAT